jgi:3-oxoacyl-[acyl-carrier protein] reductase
MLLQDKTALVYGAGGAIGRAVALAFAREGATLCLAGRTLSKVRAVADEIASAGGVAHAAQVDVLDERSVEAHVAGVAASRPRIDVLFNAIAMDDIQGPTLLDMPVRDVLQPIVKGATCQLITARAVARHMIAQGSGVILTITAGPPDATPYVGGFAAACAAIEALWRTLSAEVGERGVRLICLRSAGSPDTPDLQATLHKHAQAHGMSDAEVLAHFGSATLLKRLPMLAEVADAATVLASDRFRAVTGTFIHVTCGSPCG